MRGTPAMLILSVLTLLAGRNVCADTAPDKSKPAFVHVHDADKAMDNAVHQAQQTLAKFVEALTKPKPGQMGFSLKKRCGDGDKCEHLWVRDVHFDGKDMRGRIDNAPLELQSPRLGDEVTIQPEEITDWMYVDGGRLVGGYTLQVYYSRLGAKEKEAFLKAVGFRVE